MSSRVSSDVFFRGGGEMGELTRDYNWENTILGNPAKWPQSLLTTVNLVLNSRYPMLLLWGPQYIQFYNDDYRKCLGDDGKHPSALGQSAPECWAEIWPMIEPMVKKVLENGESQYYEDQRYPLFRNGKVEEGFWTFSYSRVDDESGEATGVLVVCNETTKAITAYNDLLAAKNELEFAIEAADLATWDLDPATNQFIGNERLKEWFGLEADGEIELSRATDVIAEFDRQRVIDAIMYAMNWESGGHYETSYTIINPKTDVSRMVKAKGKALFDAQNNVVRFSGILQDITEEINANKDLKRALEQANLSKQAAQLGTFDLDLEKGDMEWDERCRILFGISHNREVSYENDFVANLHPDDRDRIVGIINNLFIREISDGNYDVEYRTIGVEDQKLRWVRAKGKVYFDNEKPVRFIGSVLDITEQKTDEMRKNDFIGMVSHELKTPLTSLKAYLQVLHKKAEKNSDDFVSSVLQKADNQVSKMTSLIHSFLNISRFESGKIHLKMETFQLEKLVAEMIEETKLSSTRHTISYDNCDPIIVHADREKIASVISNLLSNAVKYSPPGSSVQVACNVENDIATVSVKDEGIGIKSHELDKLFERYYRVESKNTQHISGFGIGLYLSAEIINRHNGKIWVESEEKNGSKFYFTLPLKRENTFS